MSKQNDTCDHKGFLSNTINDVDDDDQDERVDRSSHFMSCNWSH